MKRIIASTAILSSCFMILSLSSGFCQTKTGKPVFTNVKSLLAAAANINAGSINDISTKAVRDFRKKFKNVEDEKWYTISNGYLAQFAAGGIKNAVVYDNTGHWTYTISYYDEHKLPESVRAIVKRVYYDYSITRIEEIHVGDRAFYLVHMQNDSTWKNVKVEDGEMELVEDFNKM